MHDINSDGQTVGSSLHNSRDKSRAVSGLSRYKIKVNLLHYSLKAVSQYLWVISLTVRPFVCNNCDKLYWVVTPWLLTTVSTSPQRLLSMVEFLWDALIWHFNRVLCLYSVSALRNVFYCPLMFLSLIHINVTGTSFFEAPVNWTHRDIYYD